MKVKPVPNKYTQPGPYLYLTDRQIELSETPRGKVLQGNRTTTGKKLKLKYAPVTSQRYKS